MIESMRSLLYGMDNRQLMIPNNNKIMIFQQLQINVDA